MKLINIKMLNFRQFYGHQQLNFSTDDKNITIIFGENGKGKTGIFRALMFGMFGSTHLPQDNTKEKHVHLVNFIALEENIGIPVDSFVSVKFEHKNKIYEIKREMKAIKNGGKIEERLGQVTLVIIDEQGNVSKEPITDETEIKFLINEVLDEKIKDFFLFDAEKIETLTKTDSKVKEEVKTGIVKLLQIDKLESAINLLKKVHSNEKRRIVSSAQNLDLNRKQMQIDELENAINELKMRYDLKCNDRFNCQKEIDDIETRLSENEDIKRIQEKYSSELKNLDTKKSLAKEKREAIKRDLVENGHGIFLSDYYVMIKDYLSQILIDQKDLIPIEVIEKSLQEHRCACCQTDLEIHSSQLQAVQLLLQSFKRSELTPLISNINSNIHDFKVEEDGIKVEIERKLKTYRQIKDEINHLNRIILQLKEQISEKAQETENLKILENTLDSKNQYIEDLNKDIHSLEFKIDDREKEMKTLQKEYDTLLRTNEGLEMDYAMVKHIETLKNHLEDIFSDYSQKMRYQLTEEATNIFKVLIDIKDHNLIDRIEITDKYEIDLIGWDNINITQDISQGQRQVVALSFITALAKVAAGGNTKIDFPLFMDTPFGRISGNNRDHLIQNIPYLTSQWILLLTDTELSRVEEVEFKRTGKLGRWYKLDQIIPGNTQIIEIGLNETMSKRG